MNPSTIPNHCLFPALQIKLNQKKKTLSVATDPLGLFCYFFALKENTLFISNYFPAVAQFVDAPLEVDENALNETLIYGMSPPGRTLFKKIFMGHPLENLNFSAKKGLETVSKNKPSFSIGPNAPTEKIYQIFTDSVQLIYQTSNIKWTNLTGGADTRLILSCLSESQRDSMTFVFDEINSNPIHIPYDRYVVKELAHTFNLNIQYRFPMYPNRSQPGLQERLSSFSPYPHLMTGMYGGETLGGNASFCLPDVEMPLTKDKDIQEQALASRQKNLRRFCEFYDNESSFSLDFHQFLNSFYSFIYNDPTWNHPFLLAQKKTSPFINTTLLSTLFHINYEHVKNYGLYAKIYQSLPKKWTQLPFFSRMTAFDYKGIHSVDEKMKIYELLLGDQTEPKTIDFSDPLSVEYLAKPPSHSRYESINLFAGGF